MRPVFSDGIKSLRTCPVCGKPAGKNYGRYCSHACRDRDLKWQAEAARNLREIERINAEARALGLSYGQYVARRGIR